MGFSYIEGLSILFICSDTSSLTARILALQLPDYLRSTLIAFIHHRYSNILFDLTLRVSHIKSVMAYMLSNLHIDAIIGVT